MSIREHLLSIIWIICLVRKKGSGEKNLSDGNRVWLGQVYRLFKSLPVKLCQDVLDVNGKMMLYKYIDYLKLY